MIGMISITLLGPMVIKHEPLATDPYNQFSKPSIENLMGTDLYGRDVFSRVIHAGRLDLAMAATIAMLALSIGTLLGLIAGVYRGIADNLIMRLTEVLLTFPTFILALGITAAIGNTITNVIIAITIAYTPTFIRLVRGEVLRFREATFIEASICAGNSRLKIMIIHLLPNCMPVVLVQASLALGWGILDIAGLSFLGMGISPPTPEWGAMTGETARYVVNGIYWPSIFPGLFIVTAVLGFNLLGDGLREILDPRLRK